ncbi:MAG: helix-turn-helix domain-containing protein [Tissierellales bacterium]|jgi:transcriptional regulator with XRE-family HTH domain|nr:helix-turn-helix domain-containing protein [Tissierellales bacterium]
MNNVELGNTILMYMKEQKKSRLDLAHDLGTSVGVINKIILGKKAIKNTELNNVAEVLKVNVNQFLQKNQKIEMNELEIEHLYSNIENKELADFIFSLIKNLAEMETELDSHGLLEP